MSALVIAEMDAGVVAGRRPRGEAIKRPLFGANR